VFDWLAARPTCPTRRSAPGASPTGGGAVFNSLVAGVPGRVVTVETWTDLYSALMPQGLVKSGLVAGLAGSIRPSGAIRADPCRRRRSRARAGREGAGRRALEPAEARIGDDARLHGAGAATSCGIDQGARVRRLAGRRSCTSACTGTRPRPFRHATPALLSRVGLVRLLPAHVRDAAEGARRDRPGTTGHRRRRRREARTLPPVSPTFVSFPGSPPSPGAEGGAHVRPAAQAAGGLGPHVQTTIAASGAGRGSSPAHRQDTAGRRSS
jgi:hypothetical protein